MRFLTLLITAQAFAAVMLATPAPADNMSMNPRWDKCNRCLVSNIRKVQVCSWWKERTPWSPAGDWDMSQKVCLCVLSKDGGWFEGCSSPHFSQEYAMDIFGAHLECAPEDSDDFVEYKQKMGPSLPRLFKIEYNETASQNLSGAKWSAV
ncbi:hypothetical protein BGZ93_008934 [Podila epicladia]|nr:hypothetical protein BGZ93_008934 [Podila epicladia]